ncbi:hypothetical protein J7413_11760 [Shimia sp. R10_1]|uniref:hypothetical protein n=1 Tax=Shimia sp. R10_1 TaxID=2821095 RepID=UPI001ADBE7A5|nr:hypothetical protein [Shimia sp. R10_1]MBO9474216.1 hypothetical protein [Shimia sp. R10_1]
MTIAARLDALCRELPNCQVVGFGDVDARLVLKAAHQDGLAREVLDSYCTEALTWFETAGAVNLNVTDGDHCVVLGAQDMRVYLRHEGRSDFLFLVCDLESDVDLVSSAGRQMLTALAGPA